MKSYIVANIIVFSMRLKYDDNIHPVKIYYNYYIIIIVIIITIRQNHSNMNIATGTNLKIAPILFKYIIERLFFFSYDIFICFK